MLSARAKRARARLRVRRGAPGARGRRRARRRPRRTVRGSQRAVLGPRAPRRAQPRAARSRRRPLGRRAVPALRRLCARPRRVDPGADRRDRAARRGGAGVAAGRDGPDRRGRGGRRARAGAGAARRRSRPGLRARVPDHHGRQPVPAGRAAARARGRRADCAECPSRRRGQSGERRPLGRCSPAAARGRCRPAGPRAGRARRWRDARDGGAARRAQRSRGGRGRRRAVGRRADRRRAAAAIRASAVAHRGRGHPGAPGEPPGCTLPRPACSAQPARRPSGSRCTCWRPSPRATTTPRALLAAAGRAALEHGAPDTAARLLGRALEEPPEDDALPAVLLDVGLAESAQGHPVAREHLRRAAETARDPLLAAHALRELVVGGRCPAQQAAP